MQGLLLQFTIIRYLGKLYAKSVAVVVVSVAGVHSVLRVPKNTELHKGTEV
jgi:hypothetical protein